MPSARPAAPSQQAPLLLTRDQALLDGLLPLTAAAGVTPEVVPDPAAGLGSWSAAPVVLVGADVAAATAGLLPPRRTGVVLVGVGRLPDQVYRDALLMGAGDVVELPSGAAWLVELLTDLGDGTAGTGLRIGVLAGCGGAGATVLACAMGQLAARAGPALLVDADPDGPGCDRVLGLEQAEGVGWEELAHTDGRLGARALREAVPAREGLGVLTWRSPPAAPLDPGVARSALEAASRGHRTVLVDLPRGGGGLTRELAARVDRLLVVTTATVLGVTAAARACARHHPAVTGLVVRGRGAAADEIADLVGVPLIAAMRDQRRLHESVDLGTGPLRSRRGPLARAAAAALAGPAP